MSKFLGGDLGNTGGLAIVEVNDDAAPRLVDAIDIPTIGVKAKERVDVIAVRKWIEAHKPDHAALERGQAFPKQGASSGFKYGRAVGALEATVTLLEIPLTIVEPTAWKKFHNLLGNRGDKEASRQRALQLFPSRHDLLALKKRHGVAEAALIALFAASRGDTP